MNAPRITRLEATVIALLSRGISPYPSRAGNSRLVSQARRRLERKGMLCQGQLTGALTNAGWSALRERFEWEMTRGVQT